jgi:hypothetical protein
LGLLESALETLAFMRALRVRRSTADSTAGLQRRPHLVHGCCCSKYVVDVPKLARIILWKAVEMFESLQEPYHKLP